jgi:hypothetical protein
MLDAFRMGRFVYNCVTKKYCMENGHPDSKPIKIRNDQTNRNRSKVIREALKNSQRSVAKKISKKF